MDDEQLKRALRSVGYTCFVKFADILLDTTISRETAATRLSTAAREWTLAGCHIRVGNARKIADARRVADAYRLIASSSKIDSELSRLARQRANQGRS